MKQSKRQIQKESTRDKIIEAAYAEFCARGILSTRMSDVAQASGVSHGTVFLHFKTQEELIAEVIGTYGRKIAARTHTLARGGSTVREILAAHLLGVSEYEPFYTRLALESRLLPDACRSAWIGIQSIVSFHLGQAAEREMREGSVKELPVHFLFNTWTGLLNYYLANGDLFAPEGRVIESCGADLLDNFMKLVSTGNKK